MGGCSAEIKQGTDPEGLCRTGNHQRVSDSVFKPPLALYLRVAGAGGLQWSSREAHSC